MKDNACGVSSKAQQTAFDTLSFVKPDASLAELRDQGSFFSQLLQQFNREVFSFVMGKNGQPYAVKLLNGNPYAYRLRSNFVKTAIREVATTLGRNLSKSDQNDLLDTLQTYIETSAERKEVYSRVAPIQGGVEIDLGDEDGRRVSIQEGGVNLDIQHSNCIFERDKFQEPMVHPAPLGDLKLLDKYLNLTAQERVLLIAWLSYTLAHPKQPTTKYIVLILMGLEGCGKSVLCRLLMKLVDPRQINLQVLPATPKELAAVTQGAHVSFFDNIRHISDSLSDMLCMISTGAVIANRALYTDSDLHVISLHGAVVLNSIYSIVRSPDLAQRCLRLHLKVISPDDRKSEREMEKQFEEDLPKIMRGLFDLIAATYACLPRSSVSTSVRMVDFMHWLAAMEIVKGAPKDTFQDLYLDNLNELQCDGLQENVLGVAVLEFVEKKIQQAVWQGTPAELLNELELITSANTFRESDWPKNPIALSKRLKPLVVSLATQGVNVEFSRGKNRLITLKKS